MQNRDDRHLLEDRKPSARTHASLISCSAGSGTVSVMSSASVDSGRIRASPVSAATAKDCEHGSRRKPIVVRSVLSVASAILLLVSLTLPTHSEPWGSAPSNSAASTSVTGPADLLLAAIDVTTVLIAVAVLAVVALLRKLPYGIGVVIACASGSVVSSAFIRMLAGTAQTSPALPSGQVVAVASLLGAASMVASSAWRPAVLGLGSVATLTVAAAALVADTVSITGVAASILVAFVWWPACSVVMLYSSAASAREARNPFDTAALAAQRRMGHPR